LDNIKYEVFLVNNKRGGVDTFLEQLCSVSRIRLSVNKGHFNHVNLDKFGVGSQVLGFSELPDIILNIIPFLSRKTSERVALILDILSLGLCGLVYTTLNSFWHISKLDGSKPILVVMGGYPGALHGRVFAWIASSLKNRSVVMSIHNLRGDSPPWTKLRDGFIDRYLLKKVKSWIFVSQVTLDSIDGSDFGSASSHVIYNGICDFDNAVIGENVSISVKKDVYNFGLVGTFENRKGFDLAIRAYSKVKTSGRIGILKIFGEGSIKETAVLHDLIKELDLGNSVEFVGFVKDKSEIYEAVDVIVVPSRAFESFGYVALESIQRNVPVIVSDHGGLKEVSEIIGNPNIFISDDVEALAKILVSVTENYHENVANLSVMRSKIRARFNQERMVREYEATLLNSDL